MKKSIAIVFMAIGLVLASCGTENSTTAKTGMTEADSNTSETEAVAEEKDLEKENTEETGAEDASGFFLSLEDVLAGFRDDEKQLNAKYWESQGEEVHALDRVISFYSTYKLHYPAEGLHYLSEGMVDEETLTAADCSLEDLEPYFENGCTLLIPKKFTFKNAQYFSFFEMQREFTDKGTDLLDPMEAGNEQVADVLGYFKTMLGTEDFEIVDIGGIEYVKCGTQTPQEANSAYFTVRDGNMMIVHFRSFISDEYLDEAAEFEDYIMHLFTPVPVATEDLENPQDEDHELPEEAAEYWEILGQEVPVADTRALLGKSSELRYPKEQMNLFASSRVDAQEAEATGLSQLDMEKSLMRLGTDAVLYPKKYSNADHEYTCYLQVIPEYFDRGSEFADLIDDSDEKMQKLLEKYGASESGEYNGIEYATAMINTAANGLVIVDFTVVNGDLVALTYSFTSEYFDEAMAFRSYLLNSVFRTESEAVSD